MALKYVNVDDFLHLLTEREQAELSDDTTEQNEPVIDEEIVEAHLGYAEATADSYIQRRYKLPLASVPSALKYAVFVVAKYRLYLRRGIVPEALEREYNAMLAWFVAVSREDADLFARDEMSDDAVTFGQSVNRYFDGTFFL